MWAVVPFVPEAPFSIFQVDAPPLELPDAQPLFAAAQKADSEFRFLVRAKARPVLVLADLPDPRVQEYLALRLARLSTLGSDERARAVAQQDDFLFSIEPARVPGLSESCAAMIAAPVRVHATAVDIENVLGRLEASELRVVHERFAKLFRLDLVNLVKDEIVRLGELQQRRRTR